MTISFHKYGEYFPGSGDVMVGFYVTMLSFQDTGIDATPCVFLPMFYRTWVSNGADITR